MKNAGPSTVDRRELVEWVEEAFDRYSTLAPNFVLANIEGKTEKERITCILKYKEELSRILKGDAQCDQVDCDKLLEDLHDLKRCKCPALDIVELMLLCTSGLSLTPSDSLQFDGFTAKNLSGLKPKLTEIAERVETLIKLQEYGPLAALEQIADDERPRVRRMIAKLPEALRCMAALLERFTPFSASEPAQEALEKNFFLGYFYLLLKHFGRRRFGCPTLSRLLTTMRCVRDVVTPHAKYLHSVHSVAYMKSGDIRRDPLSAIALQRRLPRMWEKTIGIHQRFRMELDVFVYLKIGKYAEYRKRGETLMSLIKQIREECEVNVPRIMAKLRRSQKAKSRGPSPSRGAPVL